MNIALDLLVLFVLGGCLYGGIRHGFIKSVFGFFANLIALGAAFFLSAPAGEFLCEKWIGPAFEKGAVEQVARLTGEQAASAAEAPVEKLLEGPQGLLDSFLKGVSATAEQIKAAFASGGDLAAARENAVRAVAQPAAETVSRILAFVVLFVLVLLLLSLVSKLLSGICSLPGLRALNTLLGGVFGALKGVLFVFVLCSVLSFAMPSMGGLGPFAVSQQTVDDTLLFGVFYENNFLPNGDPGERNG